MTRNRPMRTENERNELLPPSSYRKTYTRSKALAVSAFCIHLFIFFKTKGLILRTNNGRRQMCCAHPFIIVLQPRWHNITRRLRYFLCILRNTLLCISRLWKTRVLNVRYWPNVVYLRKCAAIPGYTLLCSVTFQSPPSRYVFTLRSFYDDCSGMGKNSSWT